MSGRLHARRLAIALVAMLALAGCSQPARLDTLWDAPQFSLTDEKNQTLGSDALAGRVWLADFIYTNCPDECPIYLSPKMAQLQKAILDRNLTGKVELVSFTVDPRRDTPEVLAGYASRYGADPRVWHFLTGPDSTIQPLLQNGFKVGAALPANTVQVTAGTPEPAQVGAHLHAGPADYKLLHTSYFLLVDAHGKIRANYDGEQVNVDEMLKGIQSLLNEG